MQAIFTSFTGNNQILMICIYAHGCYLFKHILLHQRITMGLVTSSGVTYEALSLQNNIYS